LDTAYQQGYTATVGLFRNIKENGALRELDDQVAKLRRDMSNLELEWSNMHDKLRRMMMRVAKRAEVAEKVEAANELTEPEPEVAQDQASGSGRMLTQRQRLAQQAILMRRAGMQR